MAKGEVVIHHNPKCSTSRDVLAMIREAGVEPTIDPYLKTGWTEPQLRALFAVAGVSARQALRARGDLAAELGLLATGVSEARIRAAMVAHPELVERPFVETPKGARLCRPKERLWEVLARDAG